MKTPLNDRAQYLDNVPVRPSVMPPKAGIRKHALAPPQLDSRFRGKDGRHRDVARSGACVLLCLWSLIAVRPVESAEPQKNSESAPVVVDVDVVYGRVQGAGLLADIAYPTKSEAKLPAILSVHGGRWKAGHRRDGSAINVQQWAGFGFVAMTIDYRLVGCTPVPACYQDVQCAIRFLHANADRYHIDTNRIYLIGQSAGGHMVSLAATLGDGPYPRTGGWEEASNDFRAVISVAANYELNSLSWGDIWTPTGQDPMEARTLASPVNHVRKDMQPMLVLHADNDQSVPIENALKMVEALKASGAKHVFHRYPEMGHMGINEEVIARTREFIDQQR